MATCSNAVKIAFVASLTGDATLQGYIGNPARISAYVDRATAFPFVRIDYQEMPYLTGTRKGPGINWIDRMSVRFTAFSKETSLITVDAIKNRIYDLMEDAPALSVTGGAIGMALPVMQGSRYDHKDGTAMASVEFVLSYEDTA